jgi:preprotein translocase subunit SecF
MKAMRFSWVGLILAPLLVPVIFSATMLILGEGDLLPAFPTVLVVGCIVSYGSTILLFLPCLFLLSLERQMTGFKVCLLGLVLGAVE